MLRKLKVIWDLHEYKFLLFFVCTNYWTIFFSENVNGTSGKICESSGQEKRWHRMYHRLREWWRINSLVQKYPKILADESDNVNVRVAYSLTKTKAFICML